MEKLGGPGPGWSPPSDPSPPVPKDPLGRGGQAAPPTQCFSLGSLRPVLLAPAPPEGCGAARGAGIAPGSSQAVGRRKPCQRDDDLSTGLALDPHGVGVEPEATVTGCSQTKTLVCVGAVARCGGPGAGYLQTRPGQGFSPPFLIGHSGEGSCRQRHLAALSWPRSLPQRERI